MGPLLKGQSRARCYKWPSCDVTLWRGRLLTFGFGHAGGIEAPEGEQLTSMRAVAHTAATTWTREHRDRDAGPAAG